VIRGSELVEVCEEYRHERLVFRRRRTQMPEAFALRAIVNDHAVGLARHEGGKCIRERPRQLGQIRFGIKCGQDFGERAQARGAKWFGIGEE
jgi:hypothetical protein